MSWKPSGMSLTDISGRLKAGPPETDAGALKTGSPVESSPLGAIPGWERVTIPSTTDARSATLSFSDFFTVAMDQIANQGAKNRYMFGGKTKIT